jgi:5-oxoprolinase (ATP-hydrolysing)/N-methylhydantoinase A
VHGTTLATNAIIERKGHARGLLTTRGFRDALETGTELRYDLHESVHRIPPSPWCRAIGASASPSALRFDGQVLTPLDEAEVRRAVRALRAEDVEAVAVCFLHAYANPANEEAAAKAIRSERPDLAVAFVLSACCRDRRVWPRLNHVANAYVQPLMSQYLAELS